jgi:hypothetical protein
MTAGADPSGVTIFCRSDFGLTAFSTVTYSIGVSRTFTMDQDPDVILVTCWAQDGASPPNLSPERVFSVTMSCSRDWNVNTGLCYKASGRRRLLGALTDSGPASRAANP